MALRDLGRSTWAKLAVLGVVLIAGALQGTALAPFVGPLPIVAVLLLASGPARRRVRGLMQASRVSWKSSLVLVFAFGIALVAAGHGVAPIALFLVYGWERYPVPTVLAWLAVLALGAGPWLRWAGASALAFAGVLLAFAAWVLFLAVSDEPLAGTLGSLPFLVCLAVHAAHLWRLRAPAQATNA